MQRSSPHRNETPTTFRTAIVLIPPRIEAIGTDNRFTSDPVAVYLAQLAPNSQRAVKSDLNQIAAMLSGGEADLSGIPWDQVRYQHLIAIRRRLSEQYATSSANRMLSSLRGVLREAWNLGLISAEAYQRVISVKPVKGSRLPAGRALSAGELRALFRECADDDRTAGVRDAALIAVLYGAGIRRAEVVRLDVSDVCTETGKVWIRAGKGNKDRLTYVQGLGCTAMDAWLDIRGAEAGPLFVPIRRNGKIQMRRMHEQTIYDIIRRRAEAAGIPTFSPHDLRRTFAGDLLEAGADISTVQRLLGHASVVTTQRYDRRGEAAKRHATSLLCIPYVNQERRTTATVE